MDNCHGYNGIKILTSNFISKNNSGYFLADQQLKFTAKIIVYK